MEKNFNKEKNKKFFFSIICATLGSENKINQLCYSLKRQSYKNFELIVCDQNNNDLNKQILKNYKNLKIKFIKTKIGLSNSRNCGLKICKGDYVIFLDDDVELKKNHLNLINNEFNKNKFDIICYNVVNNNNKYLLNYPQFNCYIKSIYQIFDCISSVSFAIKNNHKLFFDKKIGLGSKGVYKSGEETDFILRAIKRFQYKIFFFKSICVIHNEKKNSFFNSLKKSYYYGCGWGYVVKKHKLNFLFILKCYTKIIFNMTYHLITLNIFKTLISISTLIGRVRGLFK
jgi:glycosyltransferase involved in cell wall biosynthesis